MFNIKKMLVKSPNQTSIWKTETKNPKPHSIYILKWAMIVLCLSTFSQVHLGKFHLKSVHRKLSQGRDLIKVKFLWNICSFKLQVGLVGVELGERPVTCVKHIWMSEQNRDLGTSQPPPPSIIHPTLPFPPIKMLLKMFPVGGQKHLDAFPSSSPSLSSSTI